MLITASISKDYPAKIPGIDKLNAKKNINVRRLTKINEMGSWGVGELGSWGNRILVYLFIGILECNFIISLTVDNRQLIDH